MLVLYIAGIIGMFLGLFLFVAGMIQLVRKKGAQHGCFWMMSLGMLLCIVCIGMTFCSSLFVA